MRLILFTSVFPKCNVDVVHNEFSKVRILWIDSFFVTELASSISEQADVEVMAI